jgi:bifunctional DNase/RNase
MKRKELKILGLSYHQTQVGSYICVLSEKSGKRKIPIIIKTIEAHKIAIEIEGLSSERPTMHDVIKNICYTFNMDCQEVFIHSVLEGIFHTKIIVSNGVESIDIEITIGDGLALACIFGCPIYCDKEILDQVGVVLNDDGTQTKAEIDGEEPDDFDNYIEDVVDESIEKSVSIADLEKLIENALLNEEYEIAAQIRDRIQSIQQEGVVEKKSKKRK